jgi:transcriptional regulator with XRE-family HTH domain
MGRQRAVAAPRTRSNRRSEPLTRSCAKAPYQGPISSNPCAPEYAGVANEAADSGNRNVIRPSGERKVPMSVQNGRAFNEWLRTQLKAKKMSQRQLAQQSGVDHSSISRLVRGDRTPSLGTATKLARGLRELRDETETPHYFGLIQSSTSHPTARVEYALRSDDLLSEPQVRQVMEYYLALRSDRECPQRRRQGSGTRRPAAEQKLANASARRMPVERPAFFDSRKAPRPCRDGQPLSGGAGRL